MDPINYQTQVMTPFQSAIQGYQAGAAIRNDQQQQALQAQQLAQSQQQQQLLSSLASNPNATARDYARVMTTIPSIAENLQKAWSVRNDAQQQSTLSDLAQWGSAIKNGQPQIASGAMNARADAMETEAGGPTPESQSLRANAGVVDAHPQFALGVIQAKLAAHPDGKKVADVMAALGGEQRAQDLHPYAVLKAGAEATTAQVTAGNAPTKTDLENQRAQQDIQTAEAQRKVADLNVQIAQANSETERGKLTLERDKWSTELAKLQQAQGQGAQDSLDSTTQALSTLKQIKEHPAFKAQEYGGVWSKIKGTIPGTDRQAMDGWIDSLKGQLGYNNLLAMKASSPTGASGLGALSEGEMKMLSNLAGNLDPNSADFPKQLKSVEGFLNKAQAKTIARGQAPTAGTGTPVIMTHPTFGQVRDADVNRLMQKYPGQTREQVIQFLRDTGGK